MYVNSFLDYINIAGVILETFNLLSPFIAAFSSSILTYYFAIAKRKKEIDIEKEKELNLILSELLIYSRYLTYLRLMTSTFLLDKGQTKKEFPWEYLPKIFIRTKLFDEDTFKKYDSSVGNLKKYDPILYFNIKENRGAKAFDYIHREFIIPCLENPKSISVEIVSNANKEIQDALKVVGKILRLVSVEINNNLKNEIESYIEKNENYSTEQFKRDFLKEFNSGINLSDIDSNNKNSTDSNMNEEYLNKIRMKIEDNLRDLK